LGLLLQLEGMQLRASHRQLFKQNPEGRGVLAFSIVHIIYIGCRLVVRCVVMCCRVEI
jgi:hypothetical protein